MSKTVRKVIGIAAPIAASFIPGIGPLAGAAIGAGGGLLSGGGLRGAITGGLTGGALTGGASLLGKALGATGAGATALGGGLLGAGAGAASGGLKGALLGGTAGGIGGYTSGGGFDGLGEKLGLTGEGSLLGTAAKAPEELAQGFGNNADTVAQGFGTGSGALGSVTRAGSDLGSALGIGTGGGASTYSSGTSPLGLGAALLGGANSLDANDKAQKDLLNAESGALSQLQPYQATGTAANARLSDLLGTSGNVSASDYGTLGKDFNPGDLTQDPGYQFQLQQGTQALDRQQAAKGGYFSGSALKAAQDYGQGLADTTYNNAYQRYLQQQQQQYGMLAGQSGAGQQAASSAANINENIGNARANSQISSSNILNNTLSSLLSGSGAKRLVGYGQNGQPIYA